MATNAADYRTLGLAPGASLDEVKRAYRRLAKANHPDAAGEAALPRFLAIQAAYDRIVDPDGAANGTTRAPGTPSQPWAADADRARATHRAYGGRARRTRSTRPGTGGRAGTTGDPGPTTGGDAAGAGTSDAPPRDGKTSRRPKKATLGSTSYDGVEAEPFEPDWGGASWYGTTSGTYWTLNPKEYADPRKHGPEYQARARRAAAAEAAGATVGAQPIDDRPPDAPADPEHTTETWWEATDAGAATGDDPTAGPAASSADTAPPPPAAPGMDPLLGASWLDAGAGSFAGRVGRAVAGWAPIALGIGWLIGEVTGCGRFAASCDPVPPPLMLVAQLGVLAVLLLVPRLATVALVAAITTLAAAVPGALVLASMGGATDTGSSRAALAVILVTGWLAGVAIGVVREVRRSRPADRPVS